MLHYSINAGLRGLLMLLVFALAGCAAGPSTKVVVNENGEAETVYPARALEDYAYALGLMDAGQSAQAAKALEKMVEKYPDFSGPLTNLAILAAAADNMEAANSYLARALEVCDNCAPVWNQLGIQHREAGRFNDAEAAYLAALDSDPDYALANYNLGVLYDLYQARHEEAVVHYERYVALAADDEGTVMVGKWIADLRRRLGDGTRTAQTGGEL